MKRNLKLIEQSELLSSTPIPKIPLWENKKQKNKKKKNPKNYTKTNDGKTACQKTLRKNRGKLHE